MIIVNDKPGQLCNRVWAYSYFVAYALDHNVSIYLPYFREYRSYFEDLTSVPRVHFAIVRTFPAVDAALFHLYRVLTRGLRMLGSMIDLHSHGIYLDPVNWTRESWPPSVMADSRNVVFLGSWFHPKDVSALLRHKQTILKLFEPRAGSKKKVDALFSSLRASPGPIIGVHIRRGDYAKFHGGAYLFDDDVYKSYMKALQDEFEGRTVCFFLSSDELLDYSRFDGFTIAFNDHPAMVEDVYALSKCDYIIGPPSTFSMWASFVGDVPLRIVKRRDERILLDQFSPILHQNVFRNGEHFQHLEENADTVLHQKSIATGHFDAAEE